MESNGVLSCKLESPSKPCALSAEPVISTNHDMINRIKEAIRKIKHLTREFNELIRESETSNGDAHLGTSMLIAMRPWEAGIFKELRRPRAHER